MSIRQWMGAAGALLTLGAVGGHRQYRDGPPKHGNVSAKASNRQKALAEKAAKRRARMNKEGVDHG